MQQQGAFIVVVQAVNCTGLNETQEEVKRVCVDCKESICFEIQHMTKAKFTHMQVFLKT